MASNVLRVYDGVWACVYLITMALDWGKLVSWLRQFLDLKLFKVSLFSIRPHTFPEQDAVFCILIKGEGTRNGKGELQAAIN